MFVWFFIVILPVEKVSEYNRSVKSAPVIPVITNVFSVTRSWFIGSSEKQYY